MPSAIRRFWEDTDARYRLLRGDRARPLLAPNELFVPEDEFHRVLKPFARIELASDAAAAAGEYAASADNATERPVVESDADAAAPAAGTVAAHAGGSRRGHATHSLRQSRSIAAPTIRCARSNAM